jgi:bifunctional non-homologous end joining protein LigD
LLKFIPPQKATLVDAAPAGDTWLHEMKLDGYRIQLRIEGAKVTAFSSSGLNWTDKFRAIAEEAKALRVKSAVLDGELAVMRPDGVSSFGALQDAISDGRSDLMTFWAFDLLTLNGRSLVREPLERRKAELEKLIGKLPEHGRIQYSAHVVGNGPEFYAAACKRGLEGIISKRWDCPYVSERTKTWLKVKCRQRQEFVIGGWKKSEHSGVRSIMVGYYQRGELIYAGNVGTGFTQRIHADLMKRFRPLEVATCPFKAVPRAEARQARWLKPELVAEVEFAEWTGDGVLRHPAFKGLREDKNPRKIRRETPRTV